MQTDDTKIYQAIARRYRPQVFKDVIGQDVIITTLKNAIKNNRVSHAYIFCGIRGTGKTTIARIFAKTLNCSDIQLDCEPCNKCRSCLESIANNSLNIIEIDGASNRGIEDIRNINDSIRYVTGKDVYKIFIIDEVHMLTKEAFNALLKSLEEPPCNVKFFFATTELQKIPSTVISRCQTFELLRIKFDDLVNKLSSIAKECDVNIEEDVFKLIANYSDGSLRDGQSLLDQLICFGNKTVAVDDVFQMLNWSSKDDFFELDKAFEDIDISFSFEFAKRFFTSGKDLNFFIEMLFEHYRNIALLLVNKISVDDCIFSKSEKDGYKKSFKIYTLNQVLNILDYLSKFTLSQSKNSLKRVHLEMVLLYIVQTKNRASIDQILKHIDELKTESYKIEKNATLSTRPLEEIINAKSLQIKDVVNEKQLAIEQNANISFVRATYVQKNARYDTILNFAAIELNGRLNLK